MFLDCLIVSIVRTKLLLMLVLNRSVMLSDQFSRVPFSILLLMLSGTAALDVSSFLSSFSTMLRMMMNFRCAGLPGLEYKSFR